MTTIQFPWSIGTGNVRITFNGNGNEAITIESDRNTSGQVRSMEVSISTTKPSSPIITRKLTITQSKAGDFSLDFNSDFKLW